MGQVCMVAVTVVVVTVVVMVVDMAGVCMETTACTAQDMVLGGYMEAQECMVEAACTVVG